MPQYVFDSIQYDLFLVVVKPKLGTFLFFSCREFLSNATLWCANAWDKNSSCAIIVMNYIL